MPNLRTTLVLDVSFTALLMPTNACADADLETREPVPAPMSHQGVDRELFAIMRHHCDSAERGASAMLHEAGL